MSNPHPRPWHRNSVFGDGPRCPLTKNQRARFRYLLEANVRAGHLPDKHARVGRCLLKCLGRDGQCDPSQATLARLAGVGARTVRRATANLKRLGMLLWEQRLVHDGRQVQQTSNAYELLLPEGNPAPRADGHYGRQTKSIDKSIDYYLSVRAAEAVAAPSAAEFSSARDALAHRQRVFLENQARERLARVARAV